MTDLPPLDPCPSNKRGRHNLTAVYPDDAQYDLTLFCNRCGTMRRLPLTGAILADRMDDLSADEIMRRIGA